MDPGRRARRGVLYTARHAVIDAVGVGGDQKGAGLRHGAQHYANSRHRLSESSDGRVGKLPICACPRLYSFIATVGPLVELELPSNQRTRPGDSGSPLVIGFAQPRLAGMHIAGTPDDGSGRALSYCIPAYALLDPGNYAETAGETWQLS